MQTPDPISKNGALRVGVGFVNLHVNHKSRCEATANINRDKQCLASRFSRDKIAWFSLLAPYLPYPGRMQRINRAAALNLVVRENMIFIWLSRTPTITLIVRCYCYL
jgi:hypothetical protein